MHPDLWRRRLRWFGLVGGPLVALLVFLSLPTEYRDPNEALVPFSTAGRATLAIMAWMALWWLTEAIDVAATALLPVALFPLLGIADIKTATAAYASDLIFLFLGSFILALAMQRWGLDRRIALLTLRLTGTRPVNMVAGFMLATAVLSAFVSNTATTAMMLPIALSVVDLVLRQTSGQPLAATGPLPEVAGRNFALCLMLGIAYAASIGGIATLIGTPPNLFLAGFIKDSIAAPYRQEISFVSWLAVGAPLAVTFLPLTWLLLTRVLYPIKLKHLSGGHSLVQDQYRQLGPPNRGERIVLAVFLLTAASWITRPVLNRFELAFGATPIAPLSGLSDAGIAILAALLLFVIPVSIARREFVMDWATALKLPWGILILFGGGLSLAAAVKANGVAEFFAAQAGLFGHWPPFALVLVVVAAVIFLTELTSNTATTATLVPILAALAPGLGLHPYQLIIPATVAASCAFMMPVATPPNAIVFGSGHVTIPQMCRAGLWLNLIGIVLISTLLQAIVLAWLGTG